MGADYFTIFKSGVERFKKWLPVNGITVDRAIGELNKKVIISYLNEVLKYSSPRNGNDTMTDLGSLFQILENNDIITHNFGRKINVLRAVPTRHKSYTPVLLDKLDAHLKEHDPVILLFIQFISFNFFRPMEVCRLK